MSNPNILKNIIEIYLDEIRLLFEYLIALYIKSSGFLEHIRLSQKVSLFSGYTEIVCPIGYLSYEVFVDNIHIYRNF